MSSLHFVHVILNEVKQHLRQYFPWQLRNAH